MASRVVGGTAPSRRHLHIHSSPFPLLLETKSLSSLILSLPFECIENQTLWALNWQGSQAPTWSTKSWPPATLQLAASRRCLETLFTPSNEAIIAEALGLVFKLYGVRLEGLMGVRNLSQLLTALRKFVRAPLPFLTRFCATLGLSTSILTSLFILQAAGSPCDKPSDWPCSLTLFDSPLQLSTAKCEP